MVSNEDLKITLTFDPNNGEPAFEQETFVGDYLNVPVPHKDGFVFIGWYLNGDKTQNGPAMSMRLWIKTSW